MLYKPKRNEEINFNRKMFRFAVLFLCIYFVAQSDALPSDVQPKVREACLKENPIGSDEIDRFDKDQPLETKEGKCFSSCIFQKQIDLFKNGKFEYEVTKEAIKRNTPSAIAEIHLNILEDCKGEIKSNDICEAGYQVYLCFIKNRSKY